MNKGQGGDSNNNQIIFILGEMKGQLNAIQATQGALNNRIDGTEVAISTLRSDTFKQMDKRETEMRHEMDKHADEGKEAMNKLEEKISKLATKVGKVETRIAVIMAVAGVAWTVIQLGIKHFV
jgi:chromosome segregation ATPase